MYFRETRKGFAIRLVITFFSPAWLTAPSLAIDSFKMKNVTHPISGRLLRNSLLTTTAMLACLWNQALCADTQSDQRPNVIVLVTDDSCFGDLACYGNPIIKTPGLDKMYGESIRLADFHVSPMCTPTRAQIMTGKHCLRAGAYLVGTESDHLRTDLPTMPEIFRSNGYRTGIFGKWHLGDNYPLRPQDRGFEETMWFPQAALGDKVGTYWNDDYFDAHFLHNGKWQQYPGFCTDVLFTEAMRWMRGCTGKKEPFFCYLPVNVPHGKFFAPDKYRQMYAEKMKKLHPEVATSEAMMANFDENVGRLDAWLKESGQMDNTIVIYFSDNGGANGVQVNDHGERGWKGQITEGGHHVPFFIRWPAGRLRAAGDLPGLTQVQDLLPTVIGLAGLKNTTAFDGVDLAPVLRDANASVPDRTLIVQCQRVGPVTPADACVLWQKWRLLSGKELFNLSNDPHQDHNVIAENPAIARQLQAEFDKFWISVQPELHKHGTIIVGNDAENPVTLTPASWDGVYFVDSDDVRKGRKISAKWNLQVEKEGDYEIELRRWPVEADLPIRAAAAPGKLHDTLCYGPETIAGVAMPIARARLKIGDIDESKNVQDADKSIIFTQRLKPGRVCLQTWFYAASGNELGCAYSVYVKRL